jgi:predicted O-linked N-acetylglucosamine transferase (SPINDLY family)
MKAIFQKALKLHQAGSLDEALELYLKLIEIEPTNGHSTYLSAVIYFERADYVAAKQQIIRALRIDSKNPYYNCLAGNIHVRTGNLEKAERSFVTALTHKPDFKEALVRLSQLRSERGRIDDAERTLRQLFLVDPESIEGFQIQAQIWMNSGKYDQLGKLVDHFEPIGKAHVSYLLIRARHAEHYLQWDRVIESLRQLLALDSSHLEGLRLMGQSCLALRKYAEAVQCFETIQSHPRKNEVDLINLALAYLYNGNYRECIKVADPIMMSGRIHPELSFAKGVSLTKMERHREAINEFENAIKGGMCNRQVYHCLGTASLYCGNDDEATKCFLMALDLEPESVEVILSLGTVFQKMGRNAEARAYYKLALKYDPNCTLAYSGLALISFNEKERNNGQGLVESYYFCKKALELNPNDIACYTNFSSVLCNLGRINDSRLCFERGQEIAQKKLPVESYQLFAYNYLSEIEREELYEMHVKWASQVEGKSNISRSRFSFSNRDKRILNIGFVSPDFRLHPVSYFFKPVMARFNRARLKVFCYSNLPSDKKDCMTRELMTLSDEWRDIHDLTDTAAAAQIMEDKIDILVDLCGHTGDNRLNLFAKRSAPVQVSWLGYPNTTGLQNMDYRISDSLVEPEGDSDRLSSEKIFRIPSGFLAYQMFYDFPDVKPLPALKNGYITFGSFNNIKKISTQTFEVWAELLRSIPSSKLLLKDRNFEKSINREWLISRFSALGVSPSRLILNGLIRNNYEHLMHYENMDVSLDTFPYNGTTTTFESLMMGVPVVSLWGDRHSARVTPGILKRMGFDDFIGNNPAEYIEIACRIASDPLNLAAIRASLRARIENSMTNDPRRLSQELETAFNTMWSEWMHTAHTEQSKIAV